MENVRLLGCISHGHRDVIARLDGCPGGPGVPPAPASGLPFFVLEDLVRIALRLVAAALATACIVSLLPLAPAAFAQAPSGLVSRDLEALWYREEPDKTRKYGTTRIRATVIPNPDRDVRVGVLEEYSNATGAQWRTSVWVSSFIAASTLGKDLTSYRYDIAAGGFIDGPSAGALMAVGFMAAMTGATIRADSTMTGALAPDGSVTSVGGIPDKVHAAKATGKKRVGIPPGQAIATAAGGKEVNVIELGKELGVEVVELNDIYDAYEFLTGSKLTRGTPLEAAQMVVPEGVRKLLRAHAGTLLAQAHKDFELAKLDTTRGVRRYLVLSKVATLSAKNYLASGEEAAAYARATRAAAYAKAAVRVAGLTNPKYAEAAGSFDQSALAIAKFEADLEGPAKEGKLAPMVLVACYSALARAKGFLEVTRVLLGNALEAAQKKYKTEELVLKALQQSGVAFVPTLYLSYADIAVDMARELVHSPAEFALPLKLDSDAAIRAARALVSAASGNIDYIDALLLKDVADAKKMTLDQVRIAFATNERSYLFATKMSQEAVQKGLDVNVSLGGALSRLEQASSSYVESAMVITKYYALDAEINEKNPTERVRRDKALNSLLARAEFGAREAAAAALAKTGVVPPEAALYYQTAMKETGKSTVKNKLRALRSFWKSTIVSRAIAAIMSKP